MAGSKKSNRKGAKTRPLRADPQPTRARAIVNDSADPQTDPRKRALQMAVYNLYVIDGRSYTSIGEEIGMDREVVASYVRLEADRRAAEREKERHAEIDRSVAIYSEVGRHYRERMRQPGARGDEGRYVIQARERVDRLLGLEAAVKVLDETPQPDTAIVSVSPSHASAIMRMAIAAKPQAS